MFQPGPNDVLSRNFMKLRLLVASENANRQTDIHTYRQNSCFISIDYLKWKFDTFNRKRFRVFLAFDQGAVHQLYCTRVSDSVVCNLKRDVAILTSLCIVCYENMCKHTQVTNVCIAQSGTKYNFSQTNFEGCYPISFERHGFDRVKTLYMSTSLLRSSQGATGPQPPPPQGFYATMIFSYYGVQGTQEKKSAKKYLHANVLWPFYHFSAPKISYFDFLVPKFSIIHKNVADYFYLMCIWMIYDK